MGAVANAQCITACNVYADACDLGSAAAAGHVKIYSAGSGVPARVGVAITDQVLLAELAGSNPFFGDAANASPGALAAANPISDDTDADATGVAAFFRIVDRDGVARLQGSCSVTGGGGELQMPTLSLVQHQRVQITALNLFLAENT